MSKRPTFLATSAHVAPATPKVPHYKGVPADALLPPKGEPVYVDHPIFVSDELLSAELSAASWGLLFYWKNKMGTKKYRETYKRWILGEIPIPEKDLEKMISRRPEYAKRRGIPLTKCREDEPALKEAQPIASSEHKRLAGGLVSRMLSVFRSV